MVLLILNRLNLISQHIQVYCAVCYSVTPVCQHLMHTCMLQHRMHIQVCCAACYTISYLGKLCRMLHDHIFKNAVPHVTRSHPYFIAQDAYLDMLCCMLHNHSVCYSVCVYTVHMLHDHILPHSMSRYTVPCVIQSHPNVKVYNAHLGMLCPPCHSITLYVSICMYTVSYVYNQTLPHSLSKLSKALVKSKKHNCAKSITIYYRLNLLVHYIVNCPSLKPNQLVSYIIIWLSIAL